ncbi:MAG: hypothetical protein DRH17_13160 [Deltaproteobacteria bacterium]|nr:MAG: hypothetical protein DRH17_13160 [Deltaproteobacteria bacterium]
MPSLAKLVYFQPAARTPVKITEQSGVDLLNYQVRIILDSAWDGWDIVKPDGSDIFFLDEQGNPIYYWIEVFDYANRSAVLWVKIPLLPANDTKTIYMHFGGINPYKAYRDPENVFDLFDDFLGTALDTNKWNSNTGGGATLSVQNGLLMIHTSTTTYSGAWIWSKKLFDIPFIVEAKAIRHNAYSGGERGTGIMLVYSDWDGTSFDPYYYYPTRVILATIHRYTYYGRYNMIYDFVSGNHAYGSYSDNLGKWCLIRAIILSDRQRAQFDFNLDGSIEDDLEIANTPAVSSFYVGVGAADYRTDSDAQIDWIRVRKYASVEPLVEIQPSVYIRKDMDLM